MYTILVCDDNSLYGSHKRKIIQREKLFNKLCFLVPQFYNGYDMSQCTVVLRYLLPISKEFRTETLILSEERYEEYLKYILPIDTDLTKEWGDIKLNLTFILLDVDESGNVIQRVRKTTDCIVAVTQIPDYDSVIPDNSLMAVDQRIIMQSAQIKSLESLAERLDNNRVDDLIYSDKEERLRLSSNGIGIGKGVSIRDVMSDGIPVVDLDSNSGDNTDADHNDGCGCGCEDNVVEFGYSDTTIPEEPTDDDNVVEF